jgi:hypothetical protein
MMLPLRVEKSLSGYRLVDAADRVIASAQTYPWHGTKLEERPEFVQKNFDMLAEAANRSAQID